MHGATQELGVQYRLAAEVSAAESNEKLLALLSRTIRGLCRNLFRFEVFLADRYGDLVSAATGEAAVHEGVPSTGSRLLRDVSAGQSLRPVVVGPRASAPLTDGSVQLGLIVVDGIPGCPFTSLDLEILNGIADLFSLAFQRLRSRTAERRWASLDADRRSASVVQRNLMKCRLPADAGVKVDARYHPALDVGGDFYDLAWLEDGRIGGAIGDVSGKGVSAALIMSRVSADVGRAIRSGASPSKVLERVNGEVTDVDGETFVTVSCIHLDPLRRRLTVANAGHLPLLVRRANGEVLDFGGASGTPLGMMRCQYTDEHLELRPADIILLMTDGLVEALDRPNDRLGTKHLRRLVNTAPHDPEAINARILAAANDASCAQALDDLTLVAIQVESR